ncbi:MAG: hypothetical protein EAX89_16905 [Candidatus Lokiarchaeota archaeon]|nr:hypothetical protein [Candidatus Lokiarchaeota archaeon]
MGVENLISKTIVKVLACKGCNKECEIHFSDAEKEANFLSNYFKNDNSIMCPENKHYIINIKVREIFNLS